jgi:hypothetical protein
MKSANTELFRSSACLLGGGATVFGDLAEDIISQVESCKDVLKRRAFIACARRLTVSQSRGFSFPRVVITVSFGRYGCIKDPLC